MELKSIYKIESLKLSDNLIVATISFNREHPVFEGHFPGNPVVPGVVQIRIIKDLLEKSLQHKLFMKKAKSVKFLNVINPVVTNEVVFEIYYEEQQHGSYKIKATVKSGTETFMKYSGELVIFQ